MNGFNHLRARVRAMEALEPFPSRDKVKRVLDYVMYGAGVCAPLALLPQIIKVYSAKSAAGLSLSTWSLLAFINLLWAVYGVVHRDKHILFAHAALIVCNLTIVVAILMY